MLGKRVTDIMHLLTGYRMISQLCIRVYIVSCHCFNSLDSARIAYNL